MIHDISSSNANSFLESKNVQIRIDDVNIILIVFDMRWYVQLYLIV